MTLRDARKDHGLTQGELARRAKVSVTTVRNLEKGIYSRPHPETLAAVCSVLGIDPTRLLDGDQVRRLMPESVQRTLDLLGGWLSALPPDRRETEIAFLTRHIFGRNQG